MVVCFCDYAWLVAFKFCCITFFFCISLFSVFNLYIYIYECCLFCLVLVLKPADNLTRFIGSTYGCSLCQSYGHLSFSVIAFCKDSEVGVDV